jgi:hypothetical protein
VIIQPTKLVKKINKNKKIFKTFILKININTN